MAMSGAVGSLGGGWLLFPDRVLTDNVTLAFAALFHALSHQDAKRAEQMIVGTPYRMVAFREHQPDGQMTYHFELDIGPNASSPDP